MNVKHSLFAFITSVTFTTSASMQIAAQPADEIIYDLYPGTIVEKNQQLYLHSCQTMDIDFKLSFNHEETAQRIQQLTQEHRQFWVYLVASGEEKNGEYHMTVEDIYQEFPDATCHLKELLESLSEEAAPQDVEFCDLEDAAPE